MECSKWENHTSVTEFLLLGMSNYPDYHLVFISLLLILYSLSLVGNIFIIAAANLDTQLSSPMYFFLSNLSFVDFSLTSVTVPKCLACLLTMSFRISFQGCFTQMFLFLWLATTEVFILTVMSYDRYVAICKPLHYTLVMSKKMCFLLVGTSWFLTFLHASLHFIMTLHLCFCGPNAIQSFLCDLPPVLELSCLDTSIVHKVILAEGLFLGAVLFFLILATYASIIASILRLRSAPARKKAFLTCSSHLTAVVLFYGTSVAVYFVPSSTNSKGNNIVSSLMYTAVTPTLNSFIYSLRNDHIKSSLKKALKRKHFYGL